MAVDEKSGKRNLKKRFKVHLIFYPTNMADLSVGHLMHEIQFNGISPLKTEFFNILLNIITLSYFSHSIVIKCSLIVPYVLALLSPEY